MRGTEGGGICSSCLRVPVLWGQLSGVKHHKSEPKSTSAVESEILWHPFQKGKLGDLPGRAVVKNQCFHYRVCGFNPWLGN